MRRKAEPFFMEDKMADLSEFFLVACPFWKAGQDLQGNQVEGCLILPDFKRIFFILVEKEGP